MAKSKKKPTKYKKKNPTKSINDSKDDRQWINEAWDKGVNRENTNKEGNKGMTVPTVTARNDFLNFPKHVFKKSPEDKDIFKKHRPVTPTGEILPPLFENYGDEIENSTNGGNKPKKTRKKKRAMSYKIHQSKSNRKK